ncbi:MAG TPA: hypothetical protein VGC50_04670 [Gammaproteobacteria bacterium]
MKQEDQDLLGVIAQVVLGFGRDASSELSDLSFKLGDLLPKPLVLLDSPRVLVFCESDPLLQRGS